MDLLFEWDEDKARSNEAKHGVSFDEGRTVFGDPYAITIADPDHSEDEDRWIDVGFTARGRLVVAWYTQRGGRIRLIGCRKATQAEATCYRDARTDDRIMEMREEYDFSGGRRGKHFRAYRAGHTVRITQTDGTVEEHHYSLADGAVMLDPDLRDRFPDSESVNNALRRLIARR
jgi:uncharacterized DUF497 family protein